MPYIDPQSGFQITAFQWEINNPLITVRGRVKGAGGGRWLTDLGTYNRLTEATELGEAITDTFVEPPEII